MLGTSTRRLIAGFAGLAVAVGTLGVVAPSANAAETNLGQLFLSPTTGPVDILLDLSSHAPCPAGSAAVKVSVNGPGIDVTGMNNLLGVTQLGATTPNDQGGLTVNAAKTLKAVFQGYNVQSPTGNYVLNLRCQNSNGATILGDFLATINLVPSGTPFEGTFTVVAPAATATTTTLAQPTTPITVGATSTLTATVSPAAEGTVQFKDGAANLGAPVAVASGVATKSDAALAVGTHSLTAVFTSSDAGFTGSTSAAKTVVVNAVPATATTTTLDQPTSGITPGTATTLTATVAPAASGNVQFKDGATNLGAPVAVASGVATKAGVVLAPGVHSLTAVFTSTDVAFAGSTSAAKSVTVNPATVTTTTLTQPVAPIKAGTASSLTATITPTGTAGTVQFKDGVTNLGAPVAVSADVATASVTLAAGNRSLTAVFTPTSVAFGTSTSGAKSVVVAGVPVVTGPPVVGKVLTCATSAGGTQTFAWLVNGAVQPTYKSKTALVPGAWYAKSVTCRATFAQGATNVVQTSAVKKIALGAKLVATSKPKVKGTTKVGKKLTCSVGKWSPSATSYKYKWLRNGKTISGKTKSTYKATSKDKGKKISCQVTAVKAGYASGVAKSSSRKIS